MISITYTIIYNCFCLYIVIGFVSQLSIITAKYTTLKLFLFYFIFKDGDTIIWKYMKF